MDKKLLLIDGSGLSYRAFYALPELKTSQAVPINAVYGFVNMFLSVLEKEKPNYIAASFDKFAPTVRIEKFKEYKATRQKQPESLTSQLPLIEKYLEILNVPVFFVKGYEADDCLATIAKQAEKQGIEVVILTGDMDFLQIINEKIKVLMMRKGVKDLKLYDKTAVKERFGLRADQIRDFKALRGDASDNIPGVAGIGEVTAVKLLNQFGTIENILENLQTLSGKTKEQIEKNKDMLLLSKDLVTLNTHLDINVKWDSLKTTLISHSADNLKLVEFYKDVEFKSILSKITGIQNFTLSGGENKIDFIFVDNDKKLKEMPDILLTEEKWSICILSEDDASYAAISCGKHNYFINIDKESLKIFAKKFIKIEKIKIFANLKAFIKMFEAFDIKIDNKYFDVIIADYLIEAENTNSTIADVAARHLNYNIADKKDILGAGKDKKQFKDINLSDIASYLCHQAKAAFDLYEVLLNKITNSELQNLYYNIELPLALVLAHMEKTGITIDVKYLKELSYFIEQELKCCEKEIFSAADEGFNINSPKQVGYILFEKLKIPHLGKTKTGFKTDAQVLQELALIHPPASKILRYRELAKLKSTYIDALPPLADKNNKLYTTYSQTGTSTGRLSSSNPNLQNIPIKSEIGRKIRAAFTSSSSDNILVIADYSQIELRILAHISGDKNLIEAFKNDLDIHTQTAAGIFGVRAEDVNELMRRKAKEINFGINYGMSEFGLSQRLGISRKEAGAYISAYFKNYPNVGEYIKSVIEDAEKSGFVCTLFGRRRTIQNINSRNMGIKKQAERIAVNAPIQGTAADIIKVAMINLYNEIKKENLPAKLLLQVHDELVLEVSESYVQKLKSLAEKVMSEVITLSVPVKVNTYIGKNWNV